MNRNAALVALALLASVSIAATAFGTSAGMSANPQKQAKKALKQSSAALATANSALAATTGPAGGDLSGTYPNPSLAPAARGARAYGLISDSGSLSRSKNVASVTHPGTGLYCIALSDSIDESTAVLIVGTDFSVNGTNHTAGVEDVSVVEWDSDGSAGCAPGTMVVTSLVYDGDPTDGDSGGGDGVGDDLSLDDEQFGFMVP